MLNPLNVRTSKYNDVGLIAINIKGDTPLTNYDHNRTCYS